MSRYASRAAAQLTLISPVPRRAGDRYGSLEAGAVVDVDHGHLFVDSDVRGLEQVRVDGDGPDVVQVESVTVARWILLLSMVRITA